MSRISKGQLGVLHNFANDEADNEAKDETNGTSKAPVR